MIFDWLWKRPQNTPSGQLSDADTRQLLQDLSDRLDELEESEGARQRQWAAMEVDVTDLLDKLSRSLAKYRQRDVRAAKKAAEEEGQTDAFETRQPLSRAEQKAALRRQFSNGGRR